LLSFFAIASVLLATGRFHHQERKGSCARDHLPFYIIQPPKAAEGI